jgi:hypothetical protein
VPFLGDIVLGVSGCLVVAGLTEGIVTTWDLPLGLALGVGLVLAGTFWTLVVWRGRAPAPGPAAAFGAAPAGGPGPSPVTAGRR